MSAKCWNCNRVAHYQTAGNNPYCLDCVMSYGVTVTSIKTGKPTTQKQWNNWLNKQAKKGA